MQKKNNIKNIFLIVIFILIIGVLALAGLAYFLTTPVDTTASEKIKFVIPKGQAISIIAKRLKEAGLIRSEYAFRLLVIKDNLATKIQAGSFDLSKSQNLTEISERLTTGTEDVWITILEGWRAEEIAESVEALGLESFDKDEFLKLSLASEGTLYPDTYLVPRQITAQTLHSLLTNTFERKVLVALEDEIEASDREFKDVLIMASLVEREARDFEQMRRVAGILWNRIDISMALQVDATLQYAKGKNKQTGDWWSVPLADDKKLDSPFNTYMHTGLPPKPISNPSVNAIKATLDPIESNDLYYIHANDGKMYYADTLEKHNANVNKYLR